MPPYRLDLDVYRIGGQALLDGVPLYGPLPPTSIGIGLPFTYPPFAAMLFVRLALLPLGFSSVVTTLASVACLLGVVLIATDRRVPRNWMGWLFVLALLCGPVVETLGLGQVNIALMTLVYVDLTILRRSRWRGVLIGIAVAVKLTPAVFLAYLLIRRDWRQLIVAIGTALAATGIGFLVAPHDSVTYWPEALTNPARIGGLPYVSNQSLEGALVRLGAGDLTSTLWFIGCAILGLWTLFVMHRMETLSLPRASVLLIAVYGLIASPVSWSHHWVWCVPIMVQLLLWSRARRFDWARWLLGVGLVIFMTRIIWTMPQEADRELDWTWWQHIVGNAQLLWGLAFIALLSVAALQGGKSATHEPNHQLAARSS